MSVIKKPKILLIATGGTIASRIFENGLAPGLEASQLLSYIPEISGKYEIDAVQVSNIDSTNMTPSHWVKIVETVRDSYDRYDGFVICHGTDTMAYTSAALSYMIRNSPKPVVITGSQKPIVENNTDARQNLIDSLKYAADPESSGVVLVFNGNVIAGTRAKKTFAYSYNAFSSVNYPPLALIQGDRIIRFIKTGDIPVNARPEFSTRLGESIVILKLIPGTKPDLLEYLFGNYDVIVIESFGVGGIPDALLEVFSRQMEKWAEKGKIVVFATQVVNEGSNMEIYEVGRRVKKEFSIIEAYDMTLEATVTKLMVLTGRFGNDYKSIRREFYAPVNFDILYEDGN